MSLQKEISMKYEVHYRFNEQSNWLRVGRTSSIIEAYRWASLCNAKRHHAYEALDVVLLNTTTSKCLVFREFDENYDVDGWETSPNTLLIDAELSLKVNKPTAQTVNA